MRTRRVFLARLIACLGIWTLPFPSPAQITNAQQEAYEKRIQDLETRLAAVEGQVEALLRERTGHALATPAFPDPRPLQPASPNPSSAQTRFEMPPELIPDVGKIGASVGVLAAASLNPFDLDRGGFYGGFIDLPLINRPRWLHGKISYEIMVGLSRSTSTITTTSNVAQIANLAVLNTLNPNGGTVNINDALTGTGSAPFPVTTANRVNLRLLQVVPLSMKYTTTALDRWRLRPYGLVGFGTYVTIHSESPLTSTGVRSDATLPSATLAALQQQFGSTAPFGSTLIAGQIGESSELAARGVPAGSGNIEIGLQVGGGLDYRITRTLSIGFDGRFNKISGTNGNFGTFGSRIGFHF